MTVTFVNSGECEYCGLSWDEHRPGAEREIAWPCVTAYRAGLAASNAEPEIVAALENAADALDEDGRADAPGTTLAAVRAALAKLRP